MRIPLLVQSKLFSTPNGLAALRDGYLVVGGVIISPLNPYPKRSEGHPNISANHFD